MSAAPEFLDRRWCCEARFSVETGEHTVSARQAGGRQARTGRKVGWPRKAEPMHTFGLTKSLLRRGVPAAPRAERVKSAVSSALLLCTIARVYGS